MAMLQEASGAGGCCQYPLTPPLLLPTPPPPPLPLLQQPAPPPPPPPPPPRKVRNRRPFSRRIRASDWIRGAVLSTCSGFLGTVFALVGYRLVKRKLRRAKDGPDAPQDEPASPGAAQSPSGPQDGPPSPGAPQPPSAPQGVLICVPHAVQIGPFPPPCGPCAMQNGPYAPPCGPCAIELHEDPRVCSAM